MSSVQESGCYPQVNICSVKASALLPKTSPPSGISASSSWWTFDLFSQVSEGHWNSDMFMVPSQAHLSSVCQQPPPRTQHSWGTQLVRENEEEVQTPACAKRVGRGGVLNQVSGHRQPCKQKSTQGGNIQKVNSCCCRSGIQWALAGCRLNGLNYLDSAELQVGLEGPSLC